MTDKIFVCGLGRCGSSLMMQMLSAAGLKCPGRYPAFEDNRIDSIGFDNWMNEYQAVKVLDPQRRQIIWKRDPHARAIWIDRDPKQQTASFHKMMVTMMGLPGLKSRQDRKTWEASLKVDRQKALMRLSGSGLLITRVRFEQLIAGEIDKLAKCLGLDADLMRTVIVARDAECLPYMLEAKLLKDHANGN